MQKKILSLFFLTTMLLSACGAQVTDDSPETIQEADEVATETLAPATETEEPTSTPIPQDTITPTLEPTLTPTATLPPPENAIGCTNAARFISDVTVPDNSDLNVGEVFTKTWRVKNTGSCIWWYGYTLTHYSESSVSAPESAQLPRTNPGDTADLSIDLIAPGIPGFYRGNFVIRNPEGLAMEIEGDSRLWVIFNAVDNNTVAVSVPTITSASSGGETGVQISSGAGGTTLNHATCDFTTDSTRQDALLIAINAYRSQSGLPAYVLNQELMLSAQSQATDMACNQLFVHTGSDGSTPETRAAAAGYAGVLVTENVYGSYPPLSPEEAKEWWRLDKIDPTHNKNLISTSYSEVGIGYAFFNNFGYYVVVFGTP